MASSWDLTFSAPKSVPVLWSQVNESAINEILGAHRDAVEASHEYTEATALWPTRGEGSSSFKGKEARSPLLKSACPLTLHFCVFLLHSSV